MGGVNRTVRPVRRGLCFQPSRLVRRAPLPFEARFKEAILVRGNELFLALEVHFDLGVGDFVGHPAVPSVLQRFNAAVGGQRPRLRPIAEHSTSNPGFTLGAIAAIRHDAARCTPAQQARPRPPKAVQRVLERNSTASQERRIRGRVGARHDRRERYSFQVESPTGWIGFHTKGPEQRIAEFAEQPMKKCFGCHGDVAGRRPSERPAPHQCKRSSLRDLRNRRSASVGASSAALRYAKDASAPRAKRRRKSARVE